MIQCDNEYPICSNCRKAGAPCDKSSVRQENGQQDECVIHEVRLLQVRELKISSSYIRSLEERVEFLQSELETRPVRSNPDSNATQPTPSAFVSSDIRDATPKRSAAGVDNNAVGDLVGFLALNSEAPAYVGSSSGLPLASDLGEMVQATVWNQFLNPSRQSFISQNTGTSFDLRPEANADGGSRDRLRPGRMEESMVNGAEPPSDEMGNRILNEYFSSIFRRYPFLDREELWKLHENRWRLAKLKHDEITRAERFGIFKLYLVYAIGATMIHCEKRSKMCSQVSVASCINEICLTSPAILHLCFTTSTVHVRDTVG